MITETMPLNEWPERELQLLLQDLQNAKRYWIIREIEHPTTDMIIAVVLAAIKDVQFEQSKS